MTTKEKLKIKNQAIDKLIVINIFCASQWAHKELTTSLKPYELSLEQFNVLRILRGQKGKPANLQTITERMVAKSSNTTRLIDKLLIKELVERKVCTTNRRKVEVVITPAGLSLLNHIDIKVHDAEVKLTSALTVTEKEQLNTLLHKMRNNK